MLTFKRTKQTAAALALSTALLLQPAAWAQAPAELAPADTAVFIHISEPADWFAEMTDSPLGEKWLTMIEQDEGSGDLLAALGMDTAQFMAAYFKKDLVIIGQGEDENGQEKPSVLFTKVTKADRAHAIESLALQKQGDIAGNPVYTGEDGSGFIVLLDNWVAMADLDGYAYLEALLTQPDNTLRLADTDLYRQWTQALPANRAMTMLAIDSPQSQHALGVTRGDGSLSATYLGIDPGYDEMMTMLGEASTTDFGPLPASTISAMTFHIEPTDEAKAELDELNVLLNGKSFTDDVLPKLASPTVLFMGSIAGDQVEPAVELELPVMGMAFTMKDASVADDMDQLFNNVTLLANVAVTDFEAGLIPQRRETYNGSSFNVAELGKPIAGGLDLPEFAPLQIVYGRVGDHYIVCTQEQFFKQCVDAGKADQALQRDLGGKPHQLAEAPVMAMMARPDALGDVMLSWMTFFDKNGLTETFAAEPDPVMASDMMDLVHMLKRYAVINMQVWTGKDGLVIGQVQLEKNK